MTCLLVTLASLSPLCNPEPVDGWPVLLTFYTDAQDGIQGNGDGLYASLIPVAAEWSYKMAACPPSHFGHRVDIPAAGLSLYCGDNFGTWNGQPVETTVCNESGCYHRIDVFIDEATLQDDGLPWWNYWMMEAMWQ